MSRALGVKEFLGFWGLGFLGFWGLGVPSDLLFVPWLICWVRRVSGAVESGSRIYSS